MQRILIKLAKQQWDGDVLTYLNGFSAVKLESDVALFILEIEIMQFP